MLKLCLSATAAVFVLGGAANAGVIGGTTYQSFSGDSPFAPVDFSGGYFHLENFEDHLLNTPGVTETTGSGVTSTVGFSGAIIDSVDEDDGAVDGKCPYATGAYCDSYFGAGSTGITFVFDETILGALPTHVGVVWTDGVNPIGLEAYDAMGALLGAIGPFFSAGGGFSDQDVLEDLFVGAIFAEGIKSIRVFSGAGGGIEIDHLQYGLGQFDGEIPIPGAMLLMLSGLFGGSLLQRRRRLQG